MNDFNGKSLQIIMQSNVGMTSFNATFIKMDDHFLVVKREYVNTSSIEYLSISHIISIRINGEVIADVVK